MAKYYDEPRRDTSTSTLTDETPKYQKAAQRKKVVKGCPAMAKLLVDTLQRL